MHKTIYIDPEDEITTIVVKIRHEAADEIFLVVPKNAMLVQGVINLEILRREATKVNKNLIFITNDKQTKNLLERLELNVRDGLAEDFSDENIQIEEEEFLSRSPSDSIKEASQVKRAEEIGSESFYEKNIPTEEIKRALLDEENLPQENKQERLIVNDNGHSPVVKKRDLASSVILKQKEAINNEERRRRVEKRELPPKKAPSKNMPLMGKLDPRFEIRQKEAEKFFSSEEKRESKEKKFIRKRKAGKGLKLFFLLIVLFFILGAFGSWIFINFPKVTLFVYPKSEVLKEDFEVLASSNENSQKNNKISGQAEEIEISHELRFESTGEKSSSNKGKSRGKVKIINKYSSNSQPLMATTRILSTEGKLFRLIEGVTVPGMKDDQPGEIEVKAIADEPGTEYNIGASKFTIEGFKGNPKYEKFEVISEDKMEGGLDNIENQKVKVVVQSDIEDARSKVIDSFNNTLEAKIKDKIGEEKSFLVDSIEKEITESSSSLDAGDIGDQFTFTLRQKIRLITFNESDVKKLAIKNFEGRIPEKFVLDEDSIKLSYEKSSSDFENKELKFRVLVESLAWLGIDYQEIKNGLVHKNEKEIKEFLQNSSVIKKAEIEFSPSWLVFLPITEGKIIIEEKK